MKFSKRLVTRATLLCAAMAMAGIASAETISIACDSVGAGAEICKQGVALWEKKTGNTVKLISVPSSGSERLGLYQRERYEDRCEKEPSGFYLGFLQTG